MRSLLDILDLNIDYYKFFNENNLMIRIYVLSNKILPTLPPPDNFRKFCPF